MLFKDFGEMLINIKEYCEKNNGHIILVDNPKALRLGFLHYETEEHWEIRLIDIKKHKYNGMNVIGPFIINRDFLENFVINAESRMNLCNFLSGKNIKDLES